MGRGPMSIRYIVSVMDFNVEGHHAIFSRIRSFRKLDIARRYEAKFYKKAMRKPGRIGRIERWGSGVHNFVNGGNFSEVRDPAKHYDPVRLITITCKVT